MSEDAPPRWVQATVLVMLVNGQFQARIELPDGSDQWEDWFTWQEEGADWRRLAEPEPSGGSVSAGAWERHLAVAQGSPPPTWPKDSAALYARLAARIDRMRNSHKDVEDEVATDSAFALSLSDCPAFGLTNPAMSPTLHQVDGWYIKYKLRRNAAVGSRQVSE